MGKTVELTKSEMLRLEMIPNTKELQNLVGKKRQERSGGCIPTPLDNNALNLGSSGLMTL